MSSQEQPPPSYEQATAPAIDNHAVSTNHLNMMEEEEDYDEKSTSLTAMACCSALTSVAECCFIWYRYHKDDVYYVMILR